MILLFFYRGGPYYSITEGSHSAENSLGSISGERVGFSRDMSDCHFGLIDKSCRHEPQIIERGFVQPKVAFALNVKISFNWPKSRKHDTCVIRLERETAVVYNESAPSSHNSFMNCISNVVCH